MNGWFQVHRCLFEHWIWQNPLQGYRWVDLLGIASWRDKTLFLRNSRIDLKRGQLVISIRGLARRWKTNNRVASSYIKILETSGMVVCDRSNHSWMIITICNYDKFQKVSIKSQKEDHSEPYFMGYLPSANSEITDEERDKIGQKGHHKRNTNEKDNNIINNNLTHNVREENLKFSEELKTNDMAVEEALRSLGCSKPRLMELIEQFTNEVNFKETQHTSQGDFRKHFIDWARYQVKNDRISNGTRRKKTDVGGGEDSPDKYEARRGFDAGDHSEEDYSTSFSV